MFFEHYSDNTNYVIFDGAEHAFITNLARNKHACNYLGDPYINNCGKNGDIAGDLFKYIIPN